MSVYVDTSVLVAAVLNEPSSPHVRQWWSGLSEAPLVSELALIEFAAVASRAIRTNQLSQDDAENALRAVDLLRSSIDILQLTPADYILAERFVRNFATKLAAADAIHLAAAFHAGACIATFDFRMIEAAAILEISIALI